ncbi:hypothetical protein ALQ33_02463 [Pseudomonas syringae pv. philadelphi]|uniref:Uncharacterized protein n=1 Tax=Pseudomonas syringae pv. philadelphi TaxID=251706 RepID=A0A3M3YTN7_9PSED|nr:hypothetical protein [Pseudomonas syringae group genomosp. 3]RMO85551.1 hypothetical protein ALQ33_02463 [Pseudomonas syringae pv. philadelphi]
MRKGFIELIYAKAAGHCLLLGDDAPQAAAHVRTLWAGNATVNDSGVGYGGNDEPDNQERVGK